MQGEEVNQELLLVMLLLPVFVQSLLSLLSTISQLKNLKLNMYVASLGITVPVVDTPADIPSNVTAVVSDSEK